MPSIQQVSFNTPYSAEQQEIERRREIAKLLQQQGMTPMGPTETAAGGFAVRKSPLEGLAKVAQSYVGGLKQQEATDQQKQLQERYQADYKNMVAKGLRELQGTPAQPGGPFEDSMGIGREAPGVPATAPDPMSAMATFGGHPQGAALMPLAMQQLQRQQMIQALRGGGGAQPPQGGAGMQPGIAPQTAGGPGGMGGPAQGIPMEMWLQTDPSGKAYMEALAKQNQPIPLREGDLVRPGANGNFESVYTQPKLEAGMQPVRNAQGGVTGAEAIPGYAAGRAGIEGAKAGAQAGYDMVTIQTPQGAQMVTRQQAAQMAGGGQPQPVPQMPGQGIQSTAPDMNAAMQQFATGGGQPRTVAIGQPPRGGIPLQSGAAQKTEGEIGTGLGKRYNEVQDAGFGANKKINQATRLGGLLDQVETGKLSPAGYEIAAYAASAGFPVSKNLPNAQAVKALANEMALELRNPSGGAGMPGAMSDADRNYLQGLIANLDKTPGANKLLVEGMSKMAERERDIAKLARDYKRKNGTFDDGFYDELDKFSRENPLFDNKKTTAPSGGGAPLYAVNPQTKERIMSNDGGKTWAPAK